MELVNTSPVAAELVVSDDSTLEDAKRGCLTAKATFLVEPDGCIVLDPDSTMVLQAEDGETPLGILPSDLLHRRNRAFEVMLLAAAYAPYGRPVEEMAVTLSLGTHSVSLRVVGDREWIDGPDGPVLSAPVPFVRMPLTWERAFGGRAEVWLDERSTTQIQHPLNPRGRGFDPTRDIEGLAKLVYTADGFPRTDYVRLAPNLESPYEPISSPTDAPEPVCFAPIPRDCGIGLRRVGQALEQPEDEQPELTEVVGLRAVPQLVFEEAPLGQPVRLTGCRPEGDFSFVLPKTVPVMDYVLGERRGSRALTPQVLVLLPEERRFYIVYRHFFRMRAAEGEERSARLRFE